MLKHRRMAPVSERTWRRQQNISWQQLAKTQKGSELRPGEDGVCRLDFSQGTVCWRLWCRLYIGVRTHHRVRPKWKVMTGSVPENQDYDLPGTGDAPERPLFTTASPQMA